MRACSFSLSGKSNQNCNNLTGKSHSNNYIPVDVQKIKQQIMSIVLFPIISQQWTQVTENKFIISILKKKIKTLYDKYLLPELIFYKDVIMLAESVISEHNDVVDMEKKLYGKRNDVGTVVFRTKMIKMRPEYEVYNLIVGKPEKGETYIDDTLNYIQQLIGQENITFDKIKTQINEFMMN